MNYSKEIFDRKTGELISFDMGDWITISELATLYGVGRRQATTVLRQMGFLQIEGGGRDCRHRIADWVVNRGWGKRLKRKRDKFPFDVIGPEGTRWIGERWDAAIATVREETQTKPVSEAIAALTHFEQEHRSAEMSVQMRIYWLADNYPSLTQTQIGSALSVSQQLVSRFLSIRRAQRRKAMALNSEAA